MKKLFIILVLALLGLDGFAQWGMDSVYQCRVYETDLWSVEPFPTCYAEETEREQRQDLNAWLLSASFKRLDLKTVLEQGFNLQHKPELTMTIRGRAKYRSGHPVKNGRIVGYNFEDGMANEAPLDENGYFCLPVYDFNHGESFFLQVYDHKNNPDVYNYDIDNDTLPVMRNWQRDRQYNFTNDTFAELDLSLWGLDKDNLLPGVVVKGRLKKEDHVPTNRFYSSRYLDSSQIEARGIRSFNQLMKQFAGYVNFSAYFGYNMDFEEGEGNTIGYHGKATSARGASTLTTRGEMPFILDGIKVELDQVFNLDPSEIASIEIAAPWQTMALVGGSGCVDGAVVIRTKQFSPETVISKGVRYTPVGLSNKRLKF